MICDWLKFGLRETLSKYRDLIKDEANVWFSGCLGSCKYLDVHMAIASTLMEFENEIEPAFSVT